MEVRQTILTRTWQTFTRTSSAKGWRDAIYCSVMFDYIFTGGDATVDFENARTGIRQEFHPGDTNGMWKRGYVFVENPDCKDRIFIEFDVFKGTMCIDNVIDSCDVTPEPSSLAMIFLGTLGLEPLRRRRASRSATVPK